MTHFEGIFFRQIHVLFGVEINQAINTCYIKNWWVIPQKGILATPNVFWGLLNHRCEATLQLMTCDLIYFDIQYNYVDMRLICTCYCLLCQNRFISRPRNIQKYMTNTFHYISIKSFNNNFWNKKNITIILNTGSWII